MKLPHSTRKLLLLSLLAASIGSGVIAAEREHDTIREALRRGEVLPLEKILTIAEQHVPGEVIEIELEDKKKSGTLVYEIKVLTQTGRVREIKIDARNGTVLEIEDD
jgi:uncharacterized membrane protein YkoI